MSFNLLPVEGEEVIDRGDW